MSSFKIISLCVVVILCASVLGKPSAEEATKKKGWPVTPLNEVTSQCPHGSSFYRGCMRCLCDATMTADTRQQIPAYQHSVCAGERSHDDCPEFTCASSKLYLSHTECEGTCTCDEATKITTCKSLPCPYE